MSELRIAVGNEYMIPTGQGVLLETTLYASEASIALDGKDAKVYPVKKVVGYGELTFGVEVGDLVTLPPKAVDSLPLNFFNDNNSVNVLKSITELKRGKVIQGDIKTLITQADANVEAKTALRELLDAKRYVRMTDYELIDGYLAIGRCSLKLVQLGLLSWFRMNSLTVEQLNNIKDDYITDELIKEYSDSLI